jgi:hypothetical protein
VTTEESGARKPAREFLELNLRYTEGLNADYLMTSVNSVLISFLERGCGLEPALNFPNTVMLLPSTIIGRTFVNENNKLLKVMLSPTVLEACNLSEEEFERLLKENLKSALKDASEGSIFKHGHYLGKHLKNLGEEVSVQMNDGSVLSGEVVGFTVRGELLIANESGLHKIKPSTVKELRILWP